MHVRLRLSLIIHLDVVLCTFSLVSNLSKKKIGVIYVKLNNYTTHTFRLAKIYKALWFKCCDINRLIYVSCNIFLLKTKWNPFKTSTNLHRVKRSDFVKGLPSFACKFVTHFINSQIFFVILIPFTNR